MEANAVSLSVESSRWVLTTNTSDADAILNLGAFISVWLNNVWNIVWMALIH